MTDFTYLLTMQGLSSANEVTVDGFERTLAVNYFAPFLLTHELLPLLKSSAPSRIINIGSGLHRSGRIDFADLQCKKCNAMKAYANSKLMLTTHTYELSRRLQGTGVTANVVEPGFVATNLGSNSGSLLYSLAYRMARPMQITAKKAAEAPACLASSPEVDGVTGKCFYKKKPHTMLRLTEKGRTAFRRYMQTMKQVFDDLP